MRRVLVLGAALALACLAVAANGCGVAEDDSARTISRDDVPFGLLDPAPVETSTTVQAPSTTTPVFLVLGDRVSPVTREVGPDGGVAAALAALERGADDDEAARGLRSAVPSPGIEQVAVDGTTAVVDLEGAFSTLDPAEQLLAIAQIVYTATAQPGIASVSFRLEGRTVEVPTDGANLVSRPVTAADYQTVAPPA